MSSTKVFVSYSHRDAAVAEKIADALRAFDLRTGGAVTTLSARDIPLGSDFRDAVREMVKSSDAVLVVATSPELASHSWTGYEIGMAEALGKPVILATSDRHSLSEFPEDFKSVRSVVFDPEKPEGAAREIAGRLMSKSLDA